MSEDVLGNFGCTGVIQTAGEYKSFGLSKEGTRQWSRLMLFLSCCARTREQSKPASQSSWNSTTFDHQVTRDPTCRPPKPPVLCSPARSP